MSKLTGSERRIHPRIDHNLPIRLAVNGYDFSTSTKNISCLGAYCRLDKYVPPFTKLAVKMTLPLRNLKAAKEADVECKGVVVRTEDDPDGGFNVAVFFNDIHNNQRQKISHYISQLLPGAAA
jgi:hypothetical protein